MLEGSRSTFRSAVAVLAVTTAALLLGGCITRGNILPTPTPWPTPVAGEKVTRTVQRGTVIDSFRLSGQVVPADWELLHFTVDGRLAVLNVTEGNLVEKGDVLAELDTRALGEQLAQAQVSLEQAQDQLAQQERSRRYALERARINLQMQELTLQKVRQSAELSRPLQIGQAEKELERAKLNLQKSQAAYDAIAWQPGAGASPQAMALQAATFDYEIAQARYQLQAMGDAETQVALQESQVKLAQLALRELEENADPSLQRNVAKAQMQVKALERQIEERRLRAPFAGQVVAIGLNLEGLRRGFSTRPREGQNIPAFAGLVALAKPEPLEIMVDLNSPRAGELTVGQVVTVSHYLNPGPPFAGQVVEVYVKAPGGVVPLRPPATRVALPPDAPKMTIGDWVDIHVVAEVHAGILLLPREAVRRFSGHTFVVMESEGKQRRVDVSLGLENDTHVEIRSGLREGDVVVAP